MASPLTWVVWTHVWPHLDEMLAVFLLKKHGFSVRSVVQIGPREKARLENSTFEELWNEGIICVGVGHGQFDEHGTIAQDRKEKQCTATLVAEYLGIRENPEYKMLLDHVLRNDGTGADNAFLDLATSLKLRWKHGFPSEEIFEWMFIEFAVRLADQKMVWSDEAAQAAQLSRINFVFTNGGRKLKVCDVSSNSENVVTYLKANKDYDPDVIINHNTETGLVQILPHPKRSVNINSVTFLIRKAECDARGIDWISNTHLATAESIPEVPWHAHTRTQEDKKNNRTKKKIINLLNGSPTHPDVDPTWLSVDEIVSYVCEGLREAN